MLHKILHFFKHYRHSKLYQVRHTDNTNVCLHSYLTKRNKQFIDTPQQNAIIA